MSRRRELHRRNWHRYLWREMRHLERAYARESRWLAREMHSFTRGTPENSRMLAVSGRLLLAMASRADQCRRFLGL